MEGKFEYLCSIPNDKGTFGLAPSSYIATRSLVYKCQKETVDIKTRNSLKGNFYVDDYLESFDTPEEANEPQGTTQKY
jgi:hypothetical protein